MKEQGKLGEAEENSQGRGVKGGAGREAGVRGSS